MKSSLRTLVCIILPLSAPFLEKLSAATIVVTGSQNNVLITGVEYVINGNSVVQTSSAAANTANNQTVPVLLTSITVNDGGSKTLNFYNNVNARVRNNNFAANTSGIGVRDSSPTATTILANGLPAFEDAVVNTVKNANLMNYIFYDGSVGPLPPSTTADFDLLFYHAWSPSEYLVVAERNGNTFFELTPLGSNGNPIPDANVVRFAAENSTVGTGYQWNSGYKNQYDTNAGQAMWFSVASIDKFFENTTVALADQLVYGFRIDNNGQADVKFFGASDTSFTDNPVNPLVAIPEPGTLLLGCILLTSALGLQAFRPKKRRS